MILIQYTLTVPPALPDGSRELIWCGFQPELRLTQCWDVNEAHSLFFFRKLNVYLWFYKRFALPLFDDQYIKICISLQYRSIVAEEIYKKNMLHLINILYAMPLVGYETKGAFHND